MELHFQGDICVEYEVTPTEVRLLRIGTRSALCLGSVQIANPINVNAYYRLGTEF